MTTCESLQLFIVPYCCLVHLLSGRLAVDFFKDAMDFEDAPPGARLSFTLRCPWLARCFAYVGFTSQEFFHVQDHLACL